jgi:hypothetical protein
LTYLEELLSVKDEQSAEIVKFLQAILDKLIDIILDLKTKYSKDASNISEKTYEIHSKKIQHGVFEILIAIFQIIENQNKFASFRTVIDAYLSKNFCTTLAHRPLLRIFYELMSEIYERYSSSNNVSLNGSVSTVLLPSTKLSMSQRQSSMSNATSFSSNGVSGRVFNEEKVIVENTINTIKSIT